MAKTILLIDDDDVLLALLKHECEQLGMDVLTARTALSAASLLDQTLPDLICLDVALSSGGGWAICQAMAEEPDTRRIPVIVLTDRPELATPEECDNLCVYVLQKSGSIWPRLQPVIQELVDVGHSDHGKRAVR